MSSNQDAVVDQGRSRYGVHMLHILHSGSGPVDRQHWINQVPEGERESILTWEYAEPELGVSHLVVWWKEKGAVGYDRWIKN